MRLILPLLLAAAFPAVLPAQAPKSAAPKKMTPPPPAAPRPFAFPKFTSRTLANGLTVFVVEDRRLPLVAYSLQLRAGKLNAPPAKSGLASLTAGLLREGTTTRSSQEIARLVDNAGGSLSAGSGDDFTSVSATFMKTHASLGLNLLTDIVRNPVFAQDEIDRALQQAQSGLAVQYNDIQFVLPVAATRVLFGDHPYAYPADGTPQSIRNLKREDFVAFHRQHFAPARAWLAIAGDVTAEEAFAAAEKAFGDWKATPAPDPAPPAPPAPKAQVVLIEKPDANQSQISVGHLGVPRSHPDYLTLQVANQIFGGSFNSRVMLKLRANEGLTYGAGSSFRSLRLAGGFQVSTSTRTERTADAVQFIVDLIRDWKENPATEAELAEAKAFLIGSFGVELETAGAVAGRVLAQALYGLPDDYYPRFRERVQAITLQDVEAVVRRHIDPTKLTVAVAGNTSAFAKDLAKHGPARLIPIADFDPLAPNLIREKETVVTSAEGAARARQLLDAAAQAMGGREALLAVSGYSLKGPAKLNTPQGELDATVAERVEFPGSYRLALDVMGMSIVQATDGAAAFIAQGPKAQDLPPQFAAELTKAAFTASGLGLLRAALKGEAELAPLAPADVEGRPANVLLWTRNGFEVKMFIDTETNHLRKLSYRGMGMQGPTETDVVFGPYAPAGALKLPESETVFQNGNKAIQRSLAGREFNPPADPAAFRKPAQ